MRAVGVKRQRPEAVYRTQRARPGIFADQRSKSCNDRAAGTRRNGFPPEHTAAAATSSILPAALAQPRTVAVLAKYSSSVDDARI